MLNIIKYTGKKEGFCSMLFGLLNIGQRTVVGPSWFYSWLGGEEMEKAEMIPQGNRQTH